MTTRSKLLKVLEDRKGTFLSGEEIALAAGVSRTAVWKAVNTLRKEGYPIDAVPNKGYRLSEKSDILSGEGIGKYLKRTSSVLDLHVFESVDGSTNDIVKKKAQEGAEEGYCLIAGSQSAGKGRAGRSFFSPPGTGIYLSLLLRPAHFTAEQAVRITTMAAVAACEAFESIAKEKAGIKWVNDIYMRERKVSGILTEASFDLETLLLDHAVLGIGMNVYTPEDGFPEEIKDRAGSILTASVPDAKNRIAAAFLERFYELYREKDPAEYVSAYRKRCFVTGKRITVIQAGTERDAVAEDVDENCRLIVRYEDGSVETLSSGEISIRI